MFIAYFIALAVNSVLYRIYRIYILYSKCIDVYQLSIRMYSVLKPISSGQIDTRYKIDYRHTTHNLYTTASAICTQSYPSPKKFLKKSFCISDTCSVDALFRATVYSIYSQYVQGFTVILLHLPLTQKN